MGSASAGVGSALPSQVGVTSGWALTTDGNTASWASVGGGSGVTTMTAVGSSPNANAATISGVNLTMQPADGTHPGVVTTAAQTFGGDKTIGGTVLTSGAAGPFSWAGVKINASFAGIYTAGGADVVIVGGTGGNITLQPQLTPAVVVSTTSIDGTGLGNGGSIKLKSPDGTTYTATIANGGTWSIS